MTTGSENFFQTNLPPINIADLNKIKMNQIAHNGRLLSLDDIVANTGIEFSLATYWTSLWPVALALELSLFAESNNT